MAAQFEEVGMNKLSYGCYDRAYHNSDEIDQQYVMFNKAVEINYSWHIAYYGERIFANENYAALCASTSLLNQKKTQNYIDNNLSLKNNENASKRLIISTFNEDNYIRSKYVKSLTSINKSFVAENFVIDEIDKTIREKNFSAYTNVSAFALCENYKCQNEIILVKLENLYNEFVENYIFSTPSTQADWVVNARLYEIATSCSKINSNLGNQNQANFWNGIANNHYEVIYA